MPSTAWSALAPTWTLSVRASPSLAPPVFAAVTVTLLAPPDSATDSGDTLRVYSSSSSMVMVTTWVDTLRVTQMPNQPMPTLVVKVSLNWKVSAPSTNWSSLISKPRWWLLLSPGYILTSLWKKS